MSLNIVAFCIRLAYAEGTVHLFDLYFIKLSLLSTCIGEQNYPEVLLFMHTYTEFTYAVQQ